MTGTAVISPGHTLTGRLFALVSLIRQVIILLVNF
jgi:hypothetical protein